MVGPPNLFARTLRQKRRINYYEPEEPNFDEYIYCDDCKDYVYEYCAVHGPLLVVPDDKVPLKSPHPPIVPRAALTIPKVFLHLARSNIPGAGIGVFSTLTLPRGVRFGPYRGERTKEVESDYCWQIYDRKNKPSHVVDAADPARSNWMRYVNCSRGWREQNLVAYQYQGELYYRTLKIIPRYTELLVFYGGEFARTLGVDLRNYNAPPLYAPRLGPPKKKKPKFEPPTKKAGEDTSNKTAELAQGVPLSVDTPSAIRENETTPAKTNTDKCKVNAKPGKSKLDKSKPEKPKLEKAKPEKPKLGKAKPEKAKPGKAASKQKVKDQVHNMVDSHSNYESTKNTVQSNPKKGLSNDVNNNSNTFICNDCNQNFDTKPKILDHIVLTHNSIKDPYFRCKHCPYKTITNSCLEKHVKFHDYKRKHACEICLFRFKTNLSLKLHLSSKHEVGSKKLSCDICEYRTNRLFLLNEHLKKHANTKPYACNVCSYKCNQSTHLKRHMRTHTGEKPYACNVCSYKSSDSTHLKRHMRTHTGEKPYACNVCSYKCNQSINLKTHMRTHTGEKPYSCSVCSYKCNQSINLKTHMRTHTGEKPYACNVCSYKCNQSTSLKTHIRTHGHK